MEERKIIEFFDFQFTVENWVLLECKYSDGINEDIILYHTIAESIFTIYEQYMKKVDKLKTYKKKIKEDEEKYHHKRNCYKKAIYEHQRACDHYRRTVRAFEQLAKSNEKAQREIDYDKQKNKWFSIWED